MDFGKAVEEHPGMFLGGAFAVVIAILAAAYLMLGGPAPGAHSISSAFGFPASGFLLQPAAASTLNFSGAAIERLTNATVYGVNSSGNYVSEVVAITSNNYVYNVSVQNGAQTLQFSTKRTINYSNVNLTSSAMNPTYAVNSRSNGTAIAGATGTNTISLGSAVHGKNGNFSYSLQGNGYDVVEVSLNGVSIANATASGSAAATNLANGTNNVTFRNNGTYNFTETTYNDTKVLENGTLTFVLTQTPLTAAVNNVTITSELVAGKNITIQLNGVTLGDAVGGTDTWTLGASAFVVGVNNLTFNSSDAGNNVTNASISILYNIPANATNATINYTYTASTNPCANFTNVWNVTSANINLTAPVSLLTTMGNSNTSSHVSFVDEPTVLDFNITNGDYWTTLFYWNGSAMLKVNASGKYLANGTLLDGAANTTACTNARMIAPALSSFTATNFSRSGSYVYPPQGVSTGSYVSVKRISLDRAARGTITVNDDTGRQVASFPPSDQEYYVASQTNGASPIIPGIQFNSSEVDVQYTSARTLYVTGAGIPCDNVSLGYQVSPDATTWYSGNVALANLTNSSVVYPLNDTGISFIRLQVLNDCSMSLINATVNVVAS